MTRLLPLVVCLAACGSTEDDTGKQPQDVLDERFSEGGMPEVLKNGGYIDSPFINYAGDRIYFIHSIFSPSVLDPHQAVSPEQCSHVQAEQLPGHTTFEGLEWNTDIYTVQWDGDQWSEPINLGAPVNSLAMECCMWLNADETELIFATTSDLDNDGVDEDMGTRPTGNYIATRPHRDAPWGTPTPLPGKYGTEAQGNSNYRHDIHKAPSGNLYLWEHYENGDNLLVFGERTGGSDANPTYAEPVLIEGSEHSDTQLWINDAETQLVYNHREGTETELFVRTRETASDTWSAPSVLQTTGFADSAGMKIWGEPSFDHSGSFTLFARFDTSDSSCWTPDLMVAPGDRIDGFSTPVVLNASAEP